MLTPLSVGDLDAAAALARKRHRSRWFRRAIVFFGCALLLDALFGDHGPSQTIKARHDRQRAAESVTRLKRGNAALREEVRRLQEDPATLDAAARQELGLIRPGEILIVLKDLK